MFSQLDYGILARCNQDINLVQKLYQWMNSEQR